MVVGRPSRRDAEVKLMLGCTRAEALLVLDIHNRGQSGRLLWKE